jgi:hypothetical protein
MSKSIGTGDELARKVRENLGHYLIQSMSKPGGLDKNALRAWVQLEKIQHSREELYLKAAKEADRIERANRDAGYSAPRRPPSPAPAPPQPDTSEAPGTNSSTQAPPSTTSAPATSTPLPGTPASAQVAPELAQLAARLLKLPHPASQSNAIAA